MSAEDEFLPNLLNRNLIHDIFFMSFDHMKFIYLPGRTNLKLNTQSALFIPDFFPHSCISVQIYVTGFQLLTLFDLTIFEL